MWLAPLQKAANDARVRALEEQLAGADKRHASELELARGRIALLESALAQEQSLGGKTQDALAMELARVQAAANAEAAARGAEASMREALDKATQVRGYATMEWVDI